MLINTGNTRRIEIVANHAAADGDALTLQGIKAVRAPQAASQKWRVLGWISF